MLNLRPLHNLYQTISPASLLEEDEPLIAISQLERKGKQPAGEIQWVIGLWTKAEEEIWWETRLNAEGIEDLAKQVKLPLPLPLLSQIIESLKFTPECS